MKQTEFYKRYDSQDKPRAPSIRDTIGADLAAICMPLSHGFLYQDSDRTLTVIKINDLPDPLPRFYDRKVTLFTQLKDNHPEILTKLLEKEDFEIF
jgi:hypothetical protein